MYLTATEFGELVLAEPQRDGKSGLGWLFESVRRSGKKTESK
jgi:hypothetical protein